MRVFSKSNNTVGIKSHYCFSVWSLYRESSSNDIESVYCKWAGCTLQAGLGAYCIEAGMWVCGEEGEDEQKKGQARAGGTDSRDRFCGFQVCSSRKLCPGLARHLQPLSLPVLLIHHQSWYYLVYPFTFLLSIPHYFSVNTEKINLTYLVGSWFPVLWRVDVW